MTVPDPGEPRLPELWLLLRRPVAPPEALRDVVRGPGDRASAPALLAADALLTHAVEAAAEEGRAALDSLLHSLDFDRFQALLPTEDEPR